MADENDTVIVGLRASGAKEKIYHTDPDCLSIETMVAPAGKSVSMLTDEWRECRYCADDYQGGGVPEGTDPNATRRALLATDADDLGGEA